MAERAEPTSSLPEITSDYIATLLGDFEQTVHPGCWGRIRGQEATTKHVESYDMDSLARGACTVITSLPQIREAMPEVVAIIRHEVGERRQAERRAPAPLVVPRESYQELAAEATLSRMHMVLDGVERSLHGMSTAGQFGRLARLAPIHKHGDPFEASEALGISSTIDQHGLVVLTLYPQVFQHLAQKDTRIAAILQPSQAA